MGSYLGALPPGPLVAREEELARLQFALDVVEGGAGQLILLAGEPGIGKTRLAQEVTLLAHNRGFLLATASCYERCQSLSLYPFSEALGQVYEAAPPALRAQVSRRWPTLRSLFPEQLGTPASALPADPEQQQVLIREVTGFLVALAETRPLALLLDDLHFADQDSLNLLADLARHTRSHRVLLLGTYRDGELDREHPVRRMVHDLTREHLVERITLGRLPVEGTAAMVAATVAGTEGVSEFAEFVHRRTKGNPFYIETMLQALGGHYRLVREIGTGGMGRVFEAVDTQTGERVAAKIMFSRSEADLHALRRFQQEGDVLATLHHEHIVKVKGTFIEEHASCIIMELLEGQSLGQLMQDGQLPLDRIKHLVTQVAAALAYAHEQHIIHRDIKPDNVMVVGEDQVKVTDFGIARMLRPPLTLASLTSTGLTLGTPLYMAPEQIEGKRVDGRADVYSLGAMLYHLVTGRPPFAGDDPLTVAFKHAHDVPRPPRDLNRQVPADWEAVILKALAKDPVERFQTARAMEETIGSLSADERAADVASSPQAAILAVDRHHNKRATVAHGEIVKRAGHWTRLAMSPRLLAGSIGALAVALAVLLGFHLFPAASRAAGPVRFTFRQPIAVFGTSPLRPADRLQVPSALAVDSRGNLYIADVGHSQIEVLSPQGKVVTEWGTQGPAPGQLENPVGVAVDQHRDVYVSDLGNEAVQKFSPTGKLLAEQEPIYSQNPPPPGALQSRVFSQPQGIGVDAHGHVFVVDAEDQCLAVLSSTLTLQGCWGTAGNGTNEWADPRGLAVDGTGHAYVADSGNNRIVKLSPPETYGNLGFPALSLPVLPSFRFLDTWGTSGAGPGQFVSPIGVAVDRQGNIFVVDSYTCRIQELSPAGKLLAAWGRPGSRPGEFRNPQGIAVDPQGNVYVADSGNNRIQEFAAMG
jgi:serine/threonine-protein kinase